MAKKASAAPRAAIQGKPFLHVTLRAFAHATEDPRKVRAALAFAAGFDPDASADDAARFDEGTTATKSEGHFRNPITIYETELKRTADVRRFWQHLLGEPSIRDRLRAEVDERLDDDLVFWLRLDKQLAAEKRLRLVAGEDVIVARAKLGTFPRDRDVGMRFLADFLGADDASP